MITILGFFLGGSAYISLSAANEPVDMEQTDSHSDSEEQENKRSFDDEVLWISIEQGLVALLPQRCEFQALDENLPHVSISLHCPPPNFA